MQSSTAALFYKEPSTTVICELKKGEKLANFREEFGGRIG